MIDPVENARVYSARCAYRINVSERHAKAGTYYAEFFVDARRYVIRIDETAGESALTVFEFVDEVMSPHTDRIEQIGVRFARLALVKSSGMRLER